MKKYPAWLTRTLVFAGIAVLLLALDLARDENSLLSKWREFQVCTKRNRSIFRDCIAERFPPGSDYNELEAFLLEKKGFSKVSTKPVENGTKFIFRWRPSSLTNVANYGISVVGQYDENFAVVEVTVP